SPTPPSPKTATEDPGRTSAAFSTAPSPVAPPQARRHACSKGRFRRTLTAWLLLTTRRSANVPSPEKVATLRPRQEKRLTSPASAAGTSTQKLVRSERQYRHSPQCGIEKVIT